MTLDLLNEIADLASCSLCLLALHVDERGFVISIVEPDLGQAVGQQCEADDGHE
jgi:hypothetical protein